MAGTVASNGALPSLGKLATHGRPTSWTSLGRVQSSVSLDFTSASIDATLASLGFVFARASTATRINASGVMESVASGAMRIDHDPTTLACLGGLFEEASTNAIRNSTMVGVVAGSPGTLPTNWLANDAGLTRTIVGTGTENGVPYVDIRWSGTSSLEIVQLKFDADVAVAAAPASTWTSSFYVRLVGGSLTNINSVTAGVVFRNASGVSLTEGETARAVSSGSLLSQRAAHTGVAPASTAYAQAIFRANKASGSTTVDLTLRIGAPQLEQKAFATSYIPTSTAAVTRNADALRCSAPGAWFLQSAGSLVARARNNSGAGARVLMEFGTSGANLDRYGLQVSATSVIQAAGVTGGVANNATTANAITTGSNFVAAGAYDASGKAAVLNGGSVAGSATGIPLSAYSIFDIGRATWGGAYFNGVIQMVAYYPRRLSDAELQSITT